LSRFLTFHSRQKSAVLERLPPSGTIFSPGNQPCFLTSKATNSRQKMKLLTLFALWTAFVIVPLESKGQEPDPGWKPPGTEEQAAVDQANERLGAIYKRLMRKLEGYPLNDLGQKALKQAERSWIKWRDDEAMLIARVGGATGSGGSGLRVDFANAQLKLINQRIEVLNEYLKQIAEDQSAND
jgi:uncharacterized protein YecT (DUF1311 family)